MIQRLIRRLLGKPSLKDATIGFLRTRDELKLIIEQREASAVAVDNRIDQLARQRNELRVEAMSAGRLLSKIEDFLA